MGLRHFSLKVCEKVESKGLTTYNEVADELVRDLKDEAAAAAAVAAASGGVGGGALPTSTGRKNDSPPGSGKGKYGYGSSDAAFVDGNPGSTSTTPRPIRNPPLGKSTFDEKNIRRRVYDALNVLMAMDIITKEKKEIMWRGLPLPGGAALASAAARRGTMTAETGVAAMANGGSGATGSAAAAALNTTHPPSASASPLSFAARLARLRAERDQLRAAVDRGSAFADELSRQATAFVNLIARNADAPAPLLRAAAAKAAAEAAEIAAVSSAAAAAEAEAAAAAAKKATEGGEATPTAPATPPTPPPLSLPTPLPLPFILIAVRPDAAVEVQIAEDNSAAAFDFHDAPFRITGAEEVRKGEGEVFLECFFS